MSATNLFLIPNKLPQEEWVEKLVDREDLRVERIISSGQSSPVGLWYEQPEDEWVSLLQGKAIIEWQGGEFTELSAGDCLLIPAGEKHRVDRTSSVPACIWLAIFMPAEKAKD